MFVLFDRYNLAFSLVLDGFEIDQFQAYPGTQPKRPDPSGIDLKDVQPFVQDWFKMGLLDDAQQQVGFPVAIDVGFVKTVYPVFDMQV